MDISMILALLGGLALFLFGMKMMSDGLEQASGDKIKHILEKITANRFLGVLVGAGITAVIQSSSATTVMVVGFVNSGIMTLRQAIWIIMGANIGTTITGQLIALDVGYLAPVFAILGVALILFAKSSRLFPFGYIIGGLGILFLGMNMMSDSMIPLRENEVFISAMSNLSNPVLGILFGAVFTAIIQSSSASVGILQAVAASGAITLSGSVYILFGQNIGTCITAVLASVGTSRNAKRTTVIHLLFNIIGTVIFVTICQFLPFVSWMEQLTPGNVSAQIANVHTTFNIATALILIPFGTLLERAAKRILPEKPDEETGMSLKFIPAQNLRKHVIGSAGIAITQINNEVCRMYALSRANIDRAFQLTTEFDRNVFEEVQKNEEYIDFLNSGISQYISEIISSEMTVRDGETVSASFKITGNIERLGDHAMNIAEYAERISKKKFRLSKDAADEIASVRELLNESLSRIVIEESEIDRESFIEISLNEEKTDELIRKYRKNELSRMKDNSIKGEVSVLYSEMLTDFERIGDHIMNIAECMEIKNKAAR